MYVSKLRGGVLIKYEKVESAFTAVVGDPVAITEEGIIPPKSERGSNKLLQNKPRSSSKQGKEKYQKYEHK